MQINYTKCINELNQTDKLEFIPVGIILHLYDDYDRLVYAMEYILRKLRSRRYIGGLPTDIIFDHCSKIINLSIAKGYIEDDKERCRYKLTYRYKHIKSIKELIENKEYRSVPLKVRYQVLLRQRWRCNTCGCVLKFSEKSNWKGQLAHIDHVHPYAKRATYPKGPKFINETANLQALCSECNIIKRDRLD